MAVDMQAFELALLDLDAEAAGVGEEAEAFLQDPTRTAHRLVTLPTAQLVAEALAGQPTAPRAADVPLLPGRAWRILPDRLLALHARRRVDVTVAQHLHLTAMVLEQWGWAHTGNRIRTHGGRRCILGAQTVVYRLGYGSQETAWEAGRLLNGALAARGITRDYREWNESPRVTADMALALVREAARAA